MSRSSLPAHIAVAASLGACASTPTEAPVTAHDAAQGRHDAGHETHGATAQPAHGADPAHAFAGHHHDAGHAAHGAMPHRFEDAAEWSKVFDDPERDAWQKPDEVVALLALTAGATVADLGAGTGYFLARLSRAVGPTGKVIALDVEPDMVRFMGDRAAREGLAGVEARVVAPDDPGLAPASVDRVLVVDTWHHIADRARYVPLLARALRPGGAVVVVDFTLEAERGPPVQHRLPAAEVARELAAAGLEATILEETLPDQYVVRGQLPAAS